MGTEARIWLYCAFGALVLGAVAIGDLVTAKTSFCHLDRGHTHYLPTAK